MFGGTGILSLLSEVGEAAGPLVGPVQVRSNLNTDAPISFDPLAKTEEPAPPNPLLSLLKPEVTVSTPLGPYKWAPYGAPSGDYAPLLVAGAGGVALAIAGAGALVGKILGTGTLLVAGAAGIGALVYVASKTKLEVGAASVQGNPEDIGAGATT